MPKINLSALKKDNNEIKEDTNAPETQTVRISLKDLKIYPEEKKVEAIAKGKEIIEPSMNLEPEKNIEEIKEQKEDTKISSKEIIEENTSGKIVTLSSLKINLEKNEEKLEEEKKEPVIVSIQDSDSNFTIVQEEKQEIFSNYKGSYFEDIEDKNDKVNDKKQIVVETKKEEVKINKEEIKEEKKEDKTNLEKYKEGQKKDKKFKIKINKKLIRGLSALTLFVFIIGGSLAILKETKVKTNVQEANNFQKNINIQNENLNIVKENDLSNVDNGEKSNTINKNIENYLLKKYKNN